MAHKAPGKHHREGISLIKLSKMFPDDATAEKWFAKTRWPEGTHCPHCGSVNVQSGAAHKSMPYRCRERECRKRFSVRTGTCMEASNLGFQIWAIAVYLMSTSLKGVSLMKLHRDLEITQKSAWHLRCGCARPLKAMARTFRSSGPMMALHTAHLIMLLIDRGNFAGVRLATGTVSDVDRPGGVSLLARCRLAE